MIEHGSDKDPSWFKSNDIFYEGFARFVKEVAPKAAIIAVEWGGTLERSKELLKELGVGRVKWIKPQNSRNMLKYIDASDLLVDQFWVGAFGTTMPKAMPLGKPSMCYVNPDLHSWCLPEMPPILNAKYPDEVFEMLAQAYKNPDWLINVGANAREWYNKYHSNKVIMKSLSRIYDESYREGIEG